jgi:hypothetical protein
MGNFEASRLSPESLCSSQLRTANRRVTTRDKTANRTSDLNLVSIQRMIPISYLVPHPRKFVISPVNVIKLLFPLTGGG